MSKRNEAHLKKLESYEAELQRKREESARLREKFKVRIRDVSQTGMLVNVRDTCDMFYSLQSYIRVPQMDINYEKSDGQGGGDHIRGCFTITQKPSVCIKGGQVLITFEEEKGNQSINPLMD